MSAAYLTDDTPVTTHTTTRGYASREALMQARNNALDRAYVQAKTGNVPTLIATRFDGTCIHETYSVHSRTTADQEYIVELSHDQTGIETMCHCPAAERGLICWHRGAARLAHTDTIPSTLRTWGRIRPRQQVAS